MLFYCEFLENGTKAETVEADTPAAAVEIIKKNHPAARFISATTEAPKKKEAYILTLKPKAGQTAHDVFLDYAATMLYSGKEAAPNMETVGSFTAEALTAADRAEKIRVLYLMINENITEYFIGHGDTVTHYTAEF